MVRYPISEIELEGLIEAQSAGWRSRANNRIERFRIAGKYDASSGIWGDVKRAYMDLQGNKCGFCEKELEGGDLARIEHDVEHFRPKSRARPWPTEKMRREKGIDFDIPQGEELSSGYYLLAYHSLNYLTSCKTCNSTLKSDFFPIRGVRVASSEDLRNMVEEDPYLIYPISDIDLDPERVITFVGTMPVPVYKSGKKHLRAKVTIRFFELDTRESLIQQRAERIISFARAYADSMEGSTDLRRERGRKDVEKMTDVRSPHAGCIRAFRRLCENDFDLAQRVYDQVWESTQKPSNA